MGFSFLGKSTKQMLEAKYELGEVLGTGTFGIVKHAVDRETGTAYALKTIDKEKARPPPPHRQSPCLPWPWPCCCCCW